MMTTRTRKQREIAEREQLIKDVARRMLVEEGYLGLSMDKVAGAIEYSKGTVYQHFSSKEDLVGALMADTMERRSAMFRRAVLFSGRTRERILAVGVADEMFFHLYPDHFWAEQIVRVNSIGAKVAQSRVEEANMHLASCMECLLGVVRDAVARGDLVLPDGHPECVVLHGLRCLAIGAHSLASMESNLPQLSEANLDQALWTNYTLLLDGYGWKPLSTELDYQDTVERIKTEIFPDEYRRQQQLVA